MRKLRRFVVVSTGLIALALTTGVSCLDPTQITVVVSTDVRCEDTKGTSFVGGRPGGLDLDTPATSTTDCAQGRIGTLVSTPSGDKNADAAFAVVMGVDRPVSECTSADHFKGCIVQRRLLRYIRHTPLELPVTMWLVCKDVECGPDTTCARSGKCVPARIGDPSRCAEGPCLPEGEELFVPGGDRPVGDGATDSPEDRSAPDGTLLDSPVDGPLVVPPAKPGSLYCPPVADGCAAGGVCCFSHSGSGGRCSSPCTAAETTMRCNRKSDCGGSDFCCGSVTDGFAIARRPPGPDALDGATPDAAIGTRVLTSTSCSPAVCAGPWICSQPADCPPPFVTCDKTSGLFTPSGIFGECK